jgi:hypothetical protein
MMLPKSRQQPCNSNDREAAKFGRASKKEAEDVSTVCIQLNTTVLMNVLQHRQRESHATSSANGRTFSPGAIDECRNRRTQKGHTIMTVTDRNECYVGCFKTQPQEPSTPLAVNISGTGRLLASRYTLETGQHGENEVRRMRACGID